MKPEIKPGLPVRFERADLADENILGYIYYHSWMSSVKDVLPARYLEPYTPESLASAMFRLIGTTYANYFLLYVDGQPSGFVAADYNADPLVGEITHLFLLPEYFGMGYGALALDRILDDLRALKKTRAALWVNASNARALRFYKKHGFAPTGEEEELFMGVPQKQIRLIRDL